MDYYNISYNKKNKYCITYLIKKKPIMGIKKIR